MTISLRIDELDGVLLKKYAEYRGESVSSFLRNIAMQQIEDDYNELYRKISEYNKMIEEMD